jgi:RsiW-degrading membrane proteinase PrsW (M82 family)
VTDVAKILVSLTPVFVLMGGLIVLDSYKLVPPRAVIAAVTAGCAAALACLPIGYALTAAHWIEPRMYTLYLAPIVEESAKAAYIIALLRKNRIGFMVDAAIYGFAVGAGFSLVENSFYLINLQDAPLVVWVVRGIGTAAVHAATMTVFAVITKRIVDQRGRVTLTTIVPGLLLAILIHSVYNHFVFSPIVSAIIVLGVLPPLVFIVFGRSERATRQWLGVGFDVDQELLEMLADGRFSESRVGRYLESLRTHFPGAVVVDMFCLLRIHTELSLRAKGILMMKRMEIPIPPDPEIPAKLEELRHLEKSIGSTGRLAIQPLIHTSGRELWQVGQLS